MGIAQENNDYPQPTDQFVRRCSPGCLKQVKKFATHGGPDLRYLRGCQASHTADHRMRSSTPSSLGRRKRDRSHQRRAMGMRTRRLREAVATPRTFFSLPTHLDRKLQVFSFATIENGGRTKLYN